jgi:hypothetical protein
MSSHHPQQSSSRGRRFFRGPAPASHPRMQYSLHPSLAAVSSIATTGSTDSEANAHTPYPTRQQYARSEAAYRGGLSRVQENKGEEEDAAPPPPFVPRQPPTMLAAMQRPDLTSEARQRILHSLAPRPGLVRRHKFVFSSDGRREQHSPITHDFSVDVTPDLLTARVHGFELIGHSLPLAEWTLPPDETRLPWRYGWCASPGQRCIWIDLRESGGGTADPMAAAAAAAATTAATPMPSSSSSPPPPPELLVAELPLPANPITHVWISEGATEEGGVERLLHLRLARRVGAALQAVLEQQQQQEQPSSAAAAAAVLELTNMEHILPGLPSRFALAPSMVVDVVVPAYTTAPQPPVAEAPLGRESQQQVVDIAYPMDDPHVLTLAVDTGSAPADVVWAASEQGALGRLVVPPPATASELAARVSAQWDRLLRHRRYYQQQQQQAPSPSLPSVRLTDASLRWTGAEDGFQLRATWTPGRLPFEAGRPTPGPGTLAMAAQACPIAAVGTDAVAPAASALSAWHVAMPTMPSLGAVPEAIVALEADRLVLRASAPPAFTYPDRQPRVPALSVGFGGSADTYFRNLQVPALSLLFVPRGGSNGGAGMDPSFWQIPVRTGGGGSGGSVQAVSLPSGEYRAEELAQAMTLAFAAHPATAALHIVAEFVPDQGFAFRSEAGALFSLAWQTDDPQYVDPARLGYRLVDESGGSAYAPHADVSGFVRSAFAAADLGLGLPSPPPLVPTLVAVEYSLRSQLLFQAKPTERVVRLAGGAEAQLLPLAVVTQRAALYHHLQPLRLLVRLPAEGLLFGTAGFGTPEAAALEAVAETVRLLRLAPLEAGAEALRAASQFPAAPELVPQFLALVHDPAAGAVGSLFDALARLLGALGRGYGSAGTVVPSGPMDADGPYRTVLAMTSPEALPAVDALLDRLADGVRVRRTVETLATLLSRIIAGPVLRGVPLHIMATGSLAALADINGGIVSSGVALVMGRAGAFGAAGLLASSASSAASSTSLSPLQALVSQYAAAVPAVTEPMPGDTIFPGYPYAFAAESLPPAAAGSLLAARVSVPLPGIFVVQAPATLAEASDARVAMPGGYDVPLADWRELGGAGAALAAYAGSEVLVTHAAGLVPDAAQAASPAQILSWEVAGPDSVRLVLAHNLPAGTGVPFTWNGGATTTTLTVTDSPLTALAKMVLIAGNYAVSLDATALEQAVLRARDLSGPTPAAAAELPRTCTLVGTGAPLPLGPLPAHLLVAELVQIALRTPPVPQLDPATGDPLPSLFAAVTIGRINEHPFSADWASRLPQRIRPERLGYVIGEWRGGEVVVAAAAAAAGTTTMAMAAAAAAATLSPTALPRTAFPLATLFSPFAVDRSPPPYLLLDVELGTYNDRYGASLQGGLGELVSLARIVGPQLTRCVAYLPVGSDGSTLRLLDRQDDRSPVFFPTGATVGRIRFRILRPDGEPYDMGGRKVMFALRFFSRDDMPDAFQFGASA